MAQAPSPVSHGPREAGSQAVLLSVKIRVLNVASNSLFGLIFKHIYIFHLKKVQIELNIFFYNSQLLICIGDNFLI